MKTIYDRPLLSHKSFYQSSKKREIFFKIYWRDKNLSSTHAPVTKRSIWRAASPHPVMVTWLGDIP